VLYPVVVVIFLAARARAN